MRARNALVSLAHCRITRPWRAPPNCRSGSPRELTRTPPGANPAAVRREGPSRGMGYSTPGLARRTAVTAVPPERKTGSDEPDVGIGSLAWGVHPGTVHSTAETTASERPTTTLMSGCIALQTCDLCRNTGMSRVGGRCGPAGGRPRFAGPPPCLSGVSDRQRPEGAQTRHRRSQGEQDL